MSEENRHGLMKFYLVAPNWARGFRIENSLEDAKRAGRSWVAQDTDTFTIVCVDIDLNGGSRTARRLAKVLARAPEGRVVYESKPDVEGTQQ